MFKIISTGWQCAQFIEQTLQSVEDQSYHSWEMMVVYDRSTDNGAELIANWADNSLPRGKRQYRLNPDQRWAACNQYEAIHDFVEDEDIIVFLDLDGDQLAHRDVLMHLLEYYSSDVLVTYGSYAPIPFVNNCPVVASFPTEVVAQNSYRQHILKGNDCFNHLRTMKGKVYKAIPIDRFKKPNGEWLRAGIDYSAMIPALELAGGHYLCIQEILCLYNHANPLADNIVHPDPDGAHSATLEVLNRPPLEPLFR